MITAKQLYNKLSKQDGWCKNTFTKGGRHCAMGWCHVFDKRDGNGHASAMTYIGRKMGIGVTSVNDSTLFYKQSTIKARVLAYLRDAMKRGL